MAKEPKAKESIRDRPRLAVAEQDLEFDVPEPKFNWLNRRREWGMRVRAGPNGMTLGSLNRGVYGEVPMTWTDKGRNPRGAIPAKGTLPVLVTMREKTELWSDRAAELYEEAIQRRWAPATDVPWQSVASLPLDVEHAICQICTELSQYANVDIEVITSWQYQMAYGYHEVKQFLATASLDAARRLEAFRKRALVNGGGLGLESTCQVNRLLLEASGGWTETVAGMVLIRGLFTLTMCRYLERYAYNDAEHAIYQHVVQDLSRLITYGMDHLKFAMAHNEEKIQTVRLQLALGDAMFGRDLRDVVLREALAIVFGGGISGARSEGMATFYDMLDTYVREQLAACAYLNLEKPIEFMPKIFHKERREAPAA